MKSRRIRRVIVVLTICTTSVVANLTAMPAAFACSNVEQHMFVRPHYNDGGIVIAGSNWMRFWNGHNVIPAACNDPRIINSNHNQVDIFHGDYFEAGRIEHKLSTQGENDIHDDYPFVEKNYPFWGGFYVYYYESPGEPCWWINTDQSPSDNQILTLIEYTGAGQMRALMECWPGSGFTNLLSSVWSPGNNLRPKSEWERLGDWTSALEHHFDMWYYDQWAGNWFPWDYQQCDLDELPFHRNGMGANETWIENVTGSC